MAENENVGFPPGLKKYIGLGFIALALVIYFTWAIFNRIIFDIGLFSFCICILFFGIFLTWLFTAQDKKYKMDLREAKRKEKEAKDSRKKGKK